MLPIFLLKIIPYLFTFHHPIAIRKIQKENINFFIENPLVKIEEYVKVEMVRGKEISVYNLQGELIANFPSTKIASDRLKLSPTCVKRVLMGTQHQHKGYKFKLN